MYRIRPIRRRGYYLFHHAILCGFYWRAVFIKLGTEDKKIHCLREGVVATPSNSIRRDTAMLATATDTELKAKSDPFTDVEEDKDELEENELEDG